MTRFLPVIVAGNPFESFSEDPTPLLSALRTVSESRFLEPVVVVHSSWLNDAVSMAGRLAASTTFIAMPDGTPSAALAAAGFLTAEFIDGKAPVALLDARVRRGSPNCFTREVTAGLQDVQSGGIVSFMKGDQPSGEFAFMPAAAVAEYEDRAPGILSYASASLRSSVSEGNVIRTPDVPFIGRGEDDMGEILLQSADLREVRRVDLSQVKLFSPWGGGHSNYDGFYAPRFPA